MTLPNFLIIGTAKSGTSSLHHYLKQHPQIYMSPTKETYFFALEGQKANFQGPGDQEAINRHAVTDIEGYRAQFRGVTNELAIGEAATMYLYSLMAPARIRHYVPDAKLIAILRNPADRAYSSFMHMVRDGREPLTDFAEALQEEEARIRNSWEHIWHYKRMGFYHGQLKRYFDLFDRDQIKVYLYGELETNPVGVLQDIFRFLGVDNAFVPDMTLRHNVSGVPKNKVSHALFNRLLNKFEVANIVHKPFLPKRLRQGLVANLHLLQDRNLVRGQLPTEIGQHLVRVYREDILKLQELIGRDLSRWLKPYKGIECLTVSSSREAM